MWPISRTSKQGSGRQQSQVMIQLRDGKNTLQVLTAREYSNLRRFSD
jgi:hypothetical protein